MKKIMITAALGLGSLFFTQCNNSGTGETGADTSSVRSADSIKPPIVTQGGLRDSIETGGSDTTAKKDTLKH